MTDSVTIREATESDTPAIQRVADAACHAVYDSILGPESTDNIVQNWYDPDQLVTQDIHPEERLFSVVVVADEVVGFVEAMPDHEEDATHHLYRIYLHPDYWGDGIGHQLLAHVEANLPEGTDELRVSVLGDNEVGVRFYEGEGFERFATHEDEQFGVERYEYRKGV
ncbi:GNAT family N-acetyltransferase [Haloarchaeobius sp. TZWWS8]|uniref:GNAT family N-acetyltransferase n=1 Tax=Haloarchaeobius sp. TZWWS8 TaxID=3446121 RepID=UPI003EB7AE5C